MPADLARLQSLVRLAERRLRVLRPRARALEARIARGPLRRPERFYDLGLALATMKRERLYMVLGHRSFRAWLAACRPMSRSAAYRLLVVVEHLGRARARGLGVERAAIVAARIARGERVPAGAASRSTRELARRVDPRAEHAARRLRAALAPMAIGARVDVRGARVTLRLSAGAAAEIAGHLGAGRLAR